MGALKYIFKANYSRFFRNLKAVSKAEGKNIVFLSFKAALCGLIYGSGLSDFLNYRFYRLSFREISTYATIRSQHRFTNSSPPKPTKRYSRSNRCF